MLKVLMLGWELPPFNSGGLGEACMGLACALIRKGVDLTFVLPKKVDVQIDGVKIVFADLKYDEACDLESVYTTSQVWQNNFNIRNLPPDFIGAAMKYAAWVANIAKKHRSDVVHAHDWLTYSAGIAAKSSLGKPLVAHVHSTEYDRTGGNFPNKTIMEIERKGLLQADRVLPVGGFMKQVLVGNYGVAPDKIRVVYNGIDYKNEKIYPQALTAFKKMGYKVVLFLGRITLQKGPEYFVKSAAKVLKYNSKTLFVVAGSGDMQIFMMGEAARLGIMNNFVFTGFLRGVERDRIFQSADIFVMPSVSEPFGIVALEAAANKTPVLISKQAGVSEVLKNCLRADFWDTDEIANKIVAVLTHKSLSYDLVNESTKELDNLTWSKSADKVVEVYKELI